MEGHPDRPAHRASPIGLGASDAEVKPQDCGVNEDIAWPELDLFVSDDLAGLGSLAEDDPVMPDWLFAEAEDAVQTNEVRAIPDLGAELARPMNARDENLARCRLFERVSRELWSAEQRKVGRETTGRRSPGDPLGRKADAWWAGKAELSDTATASGETPETAWVDAPSRDRVRLCVPFFQSVATQFRLLNQGRPEGAGRSQDWQAVNDSGGEGDNPRWPSVAEHRKHSRGVTG